MVVKCGIRNIIYGIICLICSIMFIFPKMEVHAANQSYYIDAENGDDSNSGLTPETAWKTLQKVNHTTFSAGDSILFKSGCTWTGQLYPRGSGTNEAPIVIDMYGGDQKPIIQANGQKHNTVYLQNQQYWEINNLEITNTATTVGDYRGIGIAGKNAGELHHIYIRNCYIHDVSGEVRWIGGSTDNDKTGIYHAAGFDASKRTGAVIFEVLDPGEDAKATWFENIRVEDCIIKDCSFGGVVTKQWIGNEGWGERTSFDDANWVPHQNVYVRNNYIEAVNNPYVCTAIYLTDVRSSTVEGNVISNAGCSGIEFYYSDSVLCQKNEVFGTSKNCTSADYCGIDADKSTTNITIQYNYSHGNGDGILLCQTGIGGTATVRYNVLQNNSRFSINMHSAVTASADIYNNTVYGNKKNGKLCGSSGGIKQLNTKGTFRVYNNIFYAAQSGMLIQDGTKVTYSNNCYYNVDAPTEDTNAVVEDPKFINPGTGTSGSSSGWAYESLTGYQLQADSPCIDKGTIVENPGETDFWGNLLYYNGCDIGAYEKP